MLGPNYRPIPGVYMSTLRSVLFMTSPIWPGVGPRAAVNTIPGPFHPSKQILCFCLSSPSPFLHSQFSQFPELDTFSIRARDPQKVRGAAHRDYVTSTRNINHLNKIFPFGQ